MDMLGFGTGENPMVCLFLGDLYLTSAETAILGPIKNGINGFGQVFVLAAAFYVGTEIVSVAAGESRNPRRDVPRVRAISHCICRSCTDTCKTGNKLHRLAYFIRVHRSCLLSGTHLPL